MNPESTTKRESATTEASEGYRPLKDPASVRRMFADIAPTYDFLNHCLSVNIDRVWRRRAIRRARIESGHRVLDVCTGTADLAFLAGAKTDSPSGGHVVGTDFCPEMVRLAAAKTRRQSSATAVRLGVADTLRLPFRDASFDRVTVGFGIRNVNGLAAALAEMRRVTAVGGRVVILEFTTTRSRIFNGLFGLYFNHFLPRLGRFFSSADNPRTDDAYRYLPDSVASFPDAAGLAEAMRRAGFEDISYELLSFGIAAVHVGVKSACASVDSEGVAPR